MREFTATVTASNPQRAFAAGIGTRAVAWLGRATKITTIKTT